MKDFIDIKTDKPKHKDLVLCWNGVFIQPSIYYNNSSFKGFYFYTTFYESGNSESSIYNKVRLKPKHKIQNVLSWKLIDDLI